VRVNALSAMKERPAQRTRFHDRESLARLPRHPIGERRVVGTAKTYETDEKRDDYEYEDDQNSDLNDPTPPSTVFCIVWGDCTLSQLQ
jgi:hypothetical protein